MKSEDMFPFMHTAAAAATGAATAATATATVSEKLHLTDPRNNRPARQQPKAGWQTVLARQFNQVRRSIKRQQAGSFGKSTLDYKSSQL